MSGRTIGNLILMTLVCVVIFWVFMGIKAARAAGNDEFLRMIAETGCDSRYSDEKKEDLFKTNYKGRSMTVTGEIVAVRNENASLRVLPKTRTFDVMISFVNPKAGYDLEKGQRVTITFDVLGAGGCILGYLGNHGVVQ